MSDTAPTTRRLVRVPALDPECASSRLSGVQLRERELRRPGFHFAATDAPEEFIAAYPELEQVCAEWELPTGHAIGERRPDATRILLELARRAQPPYHWFDCGDLGISHLIDELEVRHHPALRSELARLDLLIARQAEMHNRADVRTLRCGWEMFRDRFLDHLHEEEAHCFPLCRFLDQARSELLPTRAQCASQLAIMGHSHAQSQSELDEMLVLARRADIAVIDPDLGVVVHGLVAMRQALVLHTGLENGSLLKRCALLAIQRTAAA